MKTTITTRLLVALAVGYVGAALFLISEVYKSGAARTRARQAHQALMDSIAPGQVWRTPPLDPFDNTPYDREVLDIKGGWVQYRAFGTVTGASPIDDFICC